MEIIQQAIPDLDGFVDLTESELLETEGGLCFFWQRCVGFNLVPVPCWSDTCGLV